MTAWRRRMNGLRGELALLREDPSEWNLGRDVTKWPLDLRSQYALEFARALVAGCGVRDAEVLAEVGVRCDYRVKFSDDRWRGRKGVV